MTLAPPAIGDNSFVHNLFTHSITVDIPKIGLDFFTDS